MEHFTDVCEAPAKHQAAVLRRLLHLHRDTAHLRQHGIQVPAEFGGVQEPAPGSAEGATSSADQEAGGAAAVDPLSLLRQLPLTSYDAYAARIEEAVAAGRAVSEADPATQQRWEAAVAALTGAQPVYAFWCSSGTTGGQKRLPASMLSVEANIKAFGLTGECNQLAFPEAATTGKDLRFSYAREVETLPNGVKVGVSSSINYRRWVASADQDPLVLKVMQRWASPKEVIVAGDARTTYYLHLLCALAQRHAVVTMSDIFASSLLMGATILMEHREHLMADLLAGRCFSWLDGSSGAAAASLANGEAAAAAGRGSGLATAGSGGSPPGGSLSSSTDTVLPPPPAEVAAAVDACLAGLAPGPALVEELRQVFAGGREGLLERVYPNLHTVNAVMTGSMSKYVPHLRELLPTVPFISAAYGATEGMFGVGSDFIEYADAYRKAAAAASAAGAASAEGAAAAGSGGTAANGAAELANGAGSQGSKGSVPSVPSRPPGFPAFQDFPRDADGQSSYILIPDADCFLEFIPIEHADEPSPPTVGLEELEAGRRYELVASNLMGLWRYRVGDVLRCVGHFRRAPKVLVEGRTGQALNLAGEKLPEGSVVAAVAAAAAAALPLGARTLREWAAREEVLAAGSAGDSSGHYTFYVECAEGAAAGGNGNGLPNGNAHGPANGSTADSSDGALSSGQLAAFATALDAALLEAAPAYGTVRGGMVAPLRVKLVAPGAFEGIRQLAYRNGATAAQYKPPVVVSKQEQFDLLEAAVVATAIAQL